MQYLVSVIDDRTNSGTDGGDAGDRRVQRPPPGGWPLGVRGRPRRTRARRRSSTAEGRSRCSPTGPSSSRRSTWPASGSSTLPTSTSRSRSWPTGRRRATAGSRCDRSWWCEPDRRARRDHPRPPRGVGSGGRLARQALRRPRHRRRGGGRGVRDRGRAVAGRRHPAQPRRVAHHDREPQGDRPDPARAQARRQA